jgi:hypothetical protein
LILSLSLSPAIGLTRPDPIKLLPEKISINPTEFYIKSVTDDRIEKSAVANLFLSESEGKPVLFAVDLDGGGYEAIRNFMFQSIERNPLLRPINIRIKEFIVTETLSGENRIQGVATLVFTFDLEKEYGDVPLTEYRTAAKYTRSSNTISIVENTFRKLLGNSLKFINIWMNKEAPRNIKLATGLKISFKNYLEQHNDTVYYEPSRPLIWDDFRDKVRDSRYNAAIFPSFGYDQRNQLENGIISVELTLKVFVVKSASWAAAVKVNSYSLNHEQRHFDLVKLIAGRFKAKLLAESLTPDNYQGIINFEYVQFYREMNKIQEKYDLQTQHGTNSVMQEYWNRKIDKDLLLMRIEI